MRACRDRDDEGIVYLRGHVIGIVMGRMAIVIADRPAGEGARKIEVCSDVQRPACGYVHRPGGACAPLPPQRRRKILRDQILIVRL